jgi:ribonuclease R
MSRAEYQPDNLGHFGLALPEYVHFTSPIRRYPDLLVHRAIKHALPGAAHLRRGRRNALPRRREAAPEARGAATAPRRVERGVSCAPRPAARARRHRFRASGGLRRDVSAARFLGRHELPTLYRVHDKPSPERFKELKAFLRTFGVPFPRVKDIEPKHFARVLKRIRGQPYDTLVETVLLRSMSRAAYQPDNLGHFGLALAQYVHFTSPIRRYPDLLVHRAIKHALSGKKSGSFPYSPKDMDRLGQHCSMTEKRADDATRDAIAWLKCEFMLDKIGGEFDGVITGVTSFGVFVQLQDVFVEGLVHVTSLENDYYELDAPRHRLVGARSKKVYQLATPLRVRVAKVDMEQRRIDFEPVEPKVRSRAKRACGKVPDKQTRVRRRAT